MPELDDEEQPEDDGFPLGPGGGGAEKVRHGVYVLSVTGRGGRKTLHRVGECHRVPGVHYGKVEVVRKNPPAGRVSPVLHDLFPQKGQGLQKWRPLKKRRTMERSAHLIVAHRLRAQAAKKSSHKDGLTSSILAS